MLMVLFRSYIHSHFNSVSAAIKEYTKHQMDREQGYYSQMEGTLKDKSSVEMSCLSN